MGVGQNTSEASQVQTCERVCISLSQADLSRLDKIAARLGVRRSKAISMILKMLVVPSK